MPEAPLLQIEGLARSFGPRRVLRDLSVAVRSGEVVVVVGANGSGKSTLLKIVAGLLRPSRGTVTVCGASVSAQRRSLVGYAAPDLTFYGELTGTENLQFYDAVRSRQESASHYAQCLAIVGLTGRGGDAVATYSSGMRQRLRLAFATSRNPRLLLLDEPSLALDASGVELVARIVATHRERGGAVLLATNDAREASLGDRTIAVGQ